MKKIALALIVFSSMLTLQAQEISSRAKAMRMLTYAKPEYMVKDVKVLADTMIVYSLTDFVIYPIGKWENVEQYITNTQLQWYREVGYKNYYDSMSVSVNTLRRLDDSYLDMYRSITTGRVEMIAGKITDPEVKLDNGVHVGMSKEDVFRVVFKRFPKSYVADIAVLKVISGAGEVGEIYTFRGNKLRHIGIISKYKYY
ncbi:MAG: hypothetical protein J6Y98_02855 [Bacteroidales bacterium]|nr:hypothetical protein [Bacteroidales bacterium]MCR5192618.1 hypothetical protein [Bacteroidales bacterium]